jgi:hypothetical protein
MRHTGAARALLAIYFQVVVAYLGHALRPTLHLFVGLPDMEPADTILMPDI